MQILIGKVVSTKMADTATVAVRRRYRHPIYKKSISSTKKYHVHDSQGVKVGDEVRFTACKPVSKTKKWKILEVVNNAVSKPKKKTKK